MLAAAPVHLTALAVRQQMPAIGTGNCVTLRSENLILVGGERGVAEYDTRTGKAHLLFSTDMPVRFMCEVLGSLFWSDGHRAFQSRGLSKTLKWKNEADAVRSISEYHHGLLILGEWQSFLLSRSGTESCLFARDCGLVSGANPQGLATGLGPRPRWVRFDSSQHILKAIASDPIGLPGSVGDSAWLAGSKWLVPCGDGTLRTVTPAGYRVVLRFNPRNSVAQIISVCSDRWALVELLGLRRGGDRKARNRLVLVNIGAERMEQVIHSGGIFLGPLCRSGGNTLAAIDESGKLWVWRVA